MKHIGITNLLRWVGALLWCCAAFSPVWAQQEPLVGEPVKRFAAPIEPISQAGAATMPMEDDTGGAPSAIKTWTILPTDGRLATTFERWAKADGMRLIWDAQQHVMLSAADTFTGTLADALHRVLSSPAIRQSAYPLEACIYPNQPPVLRITRLSEQSLECPQ
jgi:hypothetical protein